MLFGWFLMRKFQGLPQGICLGGAIHRAPWISAQLTMVIYANASNVAKNHTDFGGQSMCRMQWMTHSAVALHGKDEPSDRPWSFPFSKNSEPTASTANWGSKYLRKFGASVRFGAWLQRPWYFSVVPWQKGFGLKRGGGARGSQACGWRVFLIFRDICRMVFCSSSLGLWTFTCVLIGTWESRNTLKTGRTAKKLPRFHHFEAISAGLCTLCYCCCCQSSPRRRKRAIEADEVSLWVYTEVFSSREIFCFDSCSLFSSRRRSPRHRKKMSRWCEDHWRQVRQWLDLEVYLTNWWVLSPVFTNRKPFGCWSKLFLDKALV